MTIPHDSASAVQVGDRPRNHVLVVDDNNLNRDILRIRLEREGCSVSEADNGQMALDALRNAEFDLVLLDVMMPVMDGFDTLQAIKDDEQLKCIPVLMVSAVQEMDMVAKCISQGADDYLTKPVNPVLLKARVHACLDRKRLQDMERRMAGNPAEPMQGAPLQAGAAGDRDVYRATVFALAELAEARDTAAIGHVRRLRDYCQLVAEQLRVLPTYAGRVDQQFVATLHDASPLHDIGKCRTPDHVLLKPGPLDAEEWVIMREHAQAGADVLCPVAEAFPGEPYIHMAMEIAGGHHERWDGTGYPRGLQGEAIPLAARIVAVCDCYDALTSPRCYRLPVSHQEALEVLRAERGAQFDPVIVDAFLACEFDVIAVDKG